MVGPSGREDNRELNDVLLLEWRLDEVKVRRADLQLRALVESSWRILLKMRVVAEEMFVGGQRALPVSGSDAKLVSKSMLAADDATVRLLHEQDLGVAGKAKEDAAMRLELAGVGCCIWGRDVAKGLARITLGAGVQGLVLLLMAEDPNLGAKDDDLAGRESRLATREVLDWNSLGGRVEAVDREEGGILRSEAPVGVWEVGRHKHGANILLDGAMGALNLAIGRRVMAASSLGTHLQLVLEEEHELL